MTRKGSSRLPIFVDALSATVDRALASTLGALAGQARRRIGIEVAADICEQFRGQYLYIPSAFSAEFKRDARDRGIAIAYRTTGPGGVRPYTGERVRQLAAEHGISDVQVYCILSRQRELARREAAPIDIDSTAEKDTCHAQN